LSTLPLPNAGQQFGSIDYKYSTHHITQKLTKALDRVEYYNDILCVEKNWMVENGIFSEENYKSLKRRNYLTVERPGKGKGSPALIRYSSIPQRFKIRVVEILGYDPLEKVKKIGFADLVKPDPKALEYFSAYRLPDGRSLPAETVVEYCTNASVLNAVRQRINSRTAKRRSLGGSGMAEMWNDVARSVERLRSDTYHTLPGNVRRLRERYKKYQDFGYECLIHKGFCNNNGRKVDERIESLLLSLYCLPEKPYAASVHDMYLQFLAGGFDVVDIKTGEIYDRSDFYEDGMPIMISESTVWNYINNPKNRIMVDKLRMGNLEFQGIHRPHHMRTAPQFSLSKISMDDRDLPRKMASGDLPKAYYSYDVLSTCIIGCSYSKKKNTALFIDCMRDMFRNLAKWGLGVPMEAEVEHHLVNQFKDDLMQAGVLFPFVRWCVPGNSQEKYAEVLNRSKKYGYEKKYQQGIGRWYAKLEANRPKRDKIFDEENSNYKEKRYEFGKLVADDRELVGKYNNDLHPNQKRFKGMTRMQVLLAHANPDLSKISRPLLVRYIGECKETHIRRNQYVRVLHKSYWLPESAIVERLQPNNRKVVAYWLPEPDSTVKTVYIYQNNLFLCECTDVEKYNTATAERTDSDREAFTGQSKFVSAFDAMVKTGKPDRIAVLPVVEGKKLPAAEELAAEPVPDRQEPSRDCTELDVDYFTKLAETNL